MRSDPVVSRTTRARQEAGLRWSELNTIMRRIRRRPSGEPTSRELKRIAELKKELAILKTGGTV